MFNPPGPRPPPIADTDLQPGDVLLSNGTDGLSRFLSEMDHGIYSHAAVWDGERVVEATLRGIKRDTLRSEKDVQWYVDVYRWHSLPIPGTVLGQDPYPSAPVTKDADDLAATKARYSYSQLLLGALLVWTSERPTSIWLRMKIRLYGDRLERWMFEHLTKAGKRGVTCTEVVCRSFYEPTPASPSIHPYEISIFIDGKRKLAGLDVLLGGPDNTGLSSSPEVRFGRLFLEAIGGIAETESAQLRNLGLLIAAASKPGAVASTAGVGSRVPLFFVTPRELQQSPNLTFIGRLSQKRRPIFRGSALGDILDLISALVAKGLDPYGAVPLRIVVGAIFFSRGIINLKHGIGSVASALHGLNLPLSSVLALALLGIELVGGASVVLGVLTRAWALCFTGIAIASIIVRLTHSAPGLQVEILLLAGSISLLAFGAGRFSLGALLKRLLQL